MSKRCIVDDYGTWISAGKERIEVLKTLHSEQRKIGWGLGAAQKDHLSKRATTWGLIRLYQLLLFTLPGTPVFTYGDEIGLQANQMSNKANQTREAPKMVWNVEKEETDGAKVSVGVFSLSLIKRSFALSSVKHFLEFHLQSNHTEYAEIRKWFRSLSDLRGKERSLLHGDYYGLYSSAKSLSFLRVWDQSERYITAVNWGDDLEELKLKLEPTGKLQFNGHVYWRYLAISVNSAIYFKLDGLCLCRGGRATRNGQGEAVNWQRLWGGLDCKPERPQAQRRTSTASAVPLHGLKMAPKDRKAAYWLVLLLMQFLNTFLWIKTALSRYISVWQNINLVG